jgi:hypothetical protein
MCNIVMLTGIVLCRAGGDTLVRVRRYDMSGMQGALPPAVDGGGAASAPPAIAPPSGGPPTYDSHYGGGGTNATMPVEPVPVEPVRWVCRAERSVC